MLGFLRTYNLFHEEKFALFDFGVRGKPKNYKKLFGVHPKILKKVGVLPGGAKVFFLRRTKATSRSIKDGFFSLKITHFSQKDVRVIMG